MSRTWIVVPCYNEAERLDASAFEAELARRTGLRFLFVDDGSGDATAEVLESVRRRRPGQVEVLSLDCNSGKAEAVRQGMRRACLHADVEYVGFWDADLATPLDEIARFESVLDRRPDLQAAIGVRLPLKGRDIRRRPIRRKLGSLFSFAASLCLGGRFVDTQCGAKLFRASSELYHVLDRPFLARWIFDVELLARWRQLRTAYGAGPIAEEIYEYPLDAWREVAGSKLKSGDFVKASLELFRIWRRHVGPGSSTATHEWLVGYSPRTLSADRELAAPADSVRQDEPPLRRAA